MPGKPSMIKAKTFDELENLIDTTGPTKETADVLFEQIKVRAIGDVYNNAEPCNKRFDDIIYLCNLFLGLADEED